MAQIIKEAVPATGGDEEQARYRRAQARVRALLGFYWHLAVYIIVIGFLAALNLITSPNALWFYWPALGWGVAIVIHGVAVLSDRFFGSRWEEEKIREYMAKDR